MNPKVIDGAVIITETTNNNLIIMEINGNSILVYKETAVELAEYILQQYKR